MLDSFASSSVLDRSAGTAPEQSSLHTSGILEQRDSRPPVFGSVISDNGKHIEWMKNLNEAMKTAAQEHKPLVCVFEEDNCGWCKQFDKELTKPAAMQLGEDAVFVKIHPSQDPDGQALASNLGINAYPTVSILDFNGTNVSERSRITGFMSADQLAAQFNPNSTSALV